MLCTLHPAQWLPAFGRLPELEAVLQESSLLLAPGPFRFLRGRAQHLSGLFQLHVQLQPRAYNRSKWSASTPEQAQSDSRLYQHSLRFSLVPEVLKMAVQTFLCHVLTPQNPKLVKIY
jgi:hypothetical protein